MAMKQNAEGTGGSRFPDGFRILQGTQEYITYMEHSSVRVWESEVEAFFDVHAHSAIEVILQHRGQAEYHLLPNDVYHVGPGEMLIVPSGWSHSLSESGDIHRHLVLFEPNPLTNLRDMPRINSMMQKPIHLHDYSELHGQVHDLLMQVVDCYDRQEPMWNTQCYSYLMQMYALLGRSYLYAAVPPRRADERNIDSAIMNSAITFINEHYMDDISLEDVAVFAGFSRYYFSRIFKQFSSMSFSEYLTRKRLNVATDLLAHTRQPIKEIARLSGFGSVATFNRVFRENRGCTPTQYRAIYGVEVPTEQSF